MIINIENTKIELTKDQVRLIEKEREKRKKAVSSFADILKYFGFKPSPGNKNCFEHANEWWAEILDHGNFQTVWMVGSGIKCSNSMPGGWIYNTPK